MNKRIKKKKAKQARQQELEQLAQNPEQIRQVFKSVGTAISNVFTTLSVAFCNAAEQWKKWGE
ncbi:hypothetical protein ACPC58_01810 [Streptococcus sp. VTCC 12905]|uniref:hypothetical protein n=1 Tax=Streptococcus sp. VTCC 12905 TaxID=3413768 RepID=UPI003D9C6C63